MSGDYRNNYSTKLKFQMLITFSLIICLTVIFVETAVYRRMENTVRKKTQEEITSMLEQLDYNVTNFMSEVEEYSYGLVLSSSTGKLLNGEYRSDQDLYQLTKDIFTKIESISSVYSYVDSVFYYGYEGTIFGRTDHIRRYEIGSGLGEPFYQSGIYTDLSEGNLNKCWYGGYSRGDFSFYTPGREEDTPYITFARKIHIINQEKPAVLVINIREDYFRNLYFYETPDSPFTRVAADSSGIVISSGDSEMIGKKVSEVMSEMSMSGSESTFFSVSNPLGSYGWTVINIVPESYLIRDAQPLRFFTILMILMGIGFSAAAVWFWGRKLTMPLKRLDETIQKIRGGEIGAVLDPKDADRLGEVGKQFNEMSSEIKELIRKNRDAEVEKKNYEIGMLLDKINPHFIYNTLNSIKWMSVIAHTDNITEAIVRLGGMLRPIFYDKGDYQILSSELSYLDDYVYIMNLRFGNTIMLHHQLPEKFQKMEIPRLILQPVLENSIYHGMKPDGSNLKIDILAEEDGNDSPYFTIAIQDDGLGMSQSEVQALQDRLDRGEDVRTVKKESHGIGLNNVNSRIRLLCGAECGLSVSSPVSGGFRTEIHLKKRSQEKDRAKDSVLTT